MTTPTEWLLLGPELFLLLGVLFIPFIPAAAGSRARSRFAIFLLVVAFAYLAWMLLPGANGLFQQYPELAAHRTVFHVFEVTPYALFFKLTFLTVALLTAIVSADYLGERKESAEYYTLLLIATIGMMVVASARDLLTIFIGLETAALASYILVGYRKTYQGPTEAATKYFIIGALSAALTLYGISLVYATAGTIDLYVLGAQLAAGDAGGPLLLAIAFLVAGFGFKVTSVPFHMWAPDVYEGCPDTVSAFIAAGSKKMGFAAFFKVFFVGLIAAKLQWDLLVGILALLTMTVGNLAALNQQSLKRLLAWSSIGQAGYILIAFPVGTEFALTGAFFHVFTHAVMKGGAFLVVAVLAARGIGDHLEDYRGLYKRAPLAALTLSVLLLSMAGIPPLAGFQSKLILFGGAVGESLDRGSVFLMVLAVAGVLNSALSLAYYARVIRVIYVEETAEAPVRVGLSMPARVVLVAALTLTVGIGLWPQGMIDLSREAAQSLLSTSP